ncbi:MAG TPA: DUF3052 domain-containing protein [Nocardioidaceae bacterium]|nr:DUF3052 domain-containing protein [Nocardioidaceae bacterium]
MSATAGDAAQKGVGSRLGVKPDMVIQELGWDDDVDEELRVAIENLTGNQLVDDEHGDVVDGVLLWWREDDGDLVDGLVDALTDLVDGGAIYLLTPKVGRTGHVDPADIADAAPTAGLATTSSLAIGKAWSATKLVAPKSHQRR